MKYKSLEKPGWLVTAKGAQREGKRRLLPDAYQAANRKHGTSGRKGRKP